MTKTTTNKQSRKLFGARFSDRLDKWKREAKDGQRRTNEVFAKMISPKTTRRSVENWCKGDNIPKEDTLKKICKIFGVPEDYFDPENATHDQLYKNSSNFIEGIGKQHVEFSKLIDLDLDLIRALANHVDFDKLFPLYAPIEYKTQDPQTGEAVCSRNVNYSDSAHVEDVDKDLRFLQVERDGKRVTLHRCDLAFLKEVQDKVVEYIEFLFYQRTKEIEEEVLKYSQECLEVTIDGETVTDPEKRKKYLKMFCEPCEAMSIEEYEKWREERSDNEEQGRNIGLTFKYKSPDFVRKHDRFAKYYFVFDDDPNPEWLPIYKPKKRYRRATQEDIDRFLKSFDKELSKHNGERAIYKSDGTVQIVKEGK